MKKVIIFDLDGTLVDSVADLAAAVNYALNECGYEGHSLEEYSLMIGHGVKNLIEVALPVEAVKSGAVESVMPLFFDYYDKNLVNNTEPYSGIRELLEKLSDMGYLLAVASNKYQKGTEKIVKTLFSEITFAAIHGKREDVAAKPDPQIVFNILDELSAMPEDIIYVGDSAVDIQTAKRAGVSNVGVAWGLRGAQELESAGADYIITDAMELLNIIAQQ